MFILATLICPSSISKSRPIIKSIVDLPAPLGPMREVIPALGIWALSGPILTFSVYAFLALSTLIIVFPSLIIRQGR